MKVTFWGVRGSIPAPGPDTIKYGGNTSCIEIRTDDNQLLILDAGTGIRKLGEKLMKEEFGRGEGRAYMFISHTHWDHIQGFPFFAPLFVAGNMLTVYGLGSSNQNLGKLLSGQMHLSYFPITIKHLAADFKFENIDKEETLDLDGFTVQSKILNHPGGSCGYRFSCNGKSVIYATDTEPYREILLQKSAEEGKESNDTEFYKKLELHVGSLEQNLIDFFKDVDVLIYDAQYTDEEYKKKIGWGHNYINFSVDMALKAKVKHLVLFHHDPVHSDDIVDALLAEQIKRTSTNKGNNIKITAAIEGEEITL